MAGLQKELGGHKQAALAQENSLLALQTALATAEKKAALQVGDVVDPDPNPALQVNPDPDPGF